MKELSDKQFDAALRRKMEHLSVDPGKDLWMQIERGLDEGADEPDGGRTTPPDAGSAFSPDAGRRELSGAGKEVGNGKAVLFRRIGAAAAVCLLAAAGIWLYQPIPLRENNMLAAGRSPIDTVSEESGSKVIILNRSRRRPAAGKTPLPETKPASGETPVREGGSEGGGSPAESPLESPAGSPGRPANSPAGGSAKSPAPPGPVRAGKPGSSERRMAAAVGGEKDASQAAFAQEDVAAEQGSFLPLAARPPETGEDRSGTGAAGAEAVLAGAVLSGVEAVPPGAENALAGSGNVRGGAEDVRRGSGSGSENTLTSLGNALNDPESSPGGPEIFSAGPEIASARVRSGKRGEPGAVIAGSEADGEGTASSPDVSAEETPDRKRPLLPPEVRQVDNVGEALNLIAATIDKSEDKFLHLTRDERSARWKGVRLDLGLVTISYNKPDSRKTKDNE